jgi:hypothetical protein
LQFQNFRCTNDSAGKRLSTVEDKLNRWSEHFAELRNSDLKVDVDLNSVSAAQAPEDEPPPSREMIAAAVKRLKIVKPPASASSPPKCSNMVTTPSSTDYTKSSA